MVKCILARELELLCDVSLQMSLDAVAGFGDVLAQRARAAAGGYYSRNFLYPTKLYVESDSSFKSLYE